MKKVLFSKLQTITVNMGINAWVSISTMLAYCNIMIMRWESKRCIYGENNQTLENNMYQKLNEISQINFEMDIV